MYATSSREFIGGPLYEQALSYQEKSVRNKFWTAVEGSDVPVLLRMQEEGVKFESFNDTLKPIVFRAVAVNSSIDVVRLLVDVMGHDSINQRAIYIADNQEREINEYTGLHTAESFSPLSAAIRSQNERMVKYLLSEGADPDFPDESGYMLCQYDLGLLEHGLEEYGIHSCAIIRMSDLLVDSSQSPLQLTIHKVQNYNIFKMLLEKKAGYSSSNPLRTMRILSPFEDQGGFNWCDNFWELCITPNADISEAESLLNANGGKYIKYIQCYFDQSRLMYQFEKGRYLYSIYNAGKCGFLTSAIQGDNKEIVSLLLSRGADPNANLKRSIIMCQYNRFGRWLQHRHDVVSDAINAVELAHRATSPLSMAVLKSNTEIALDLIDASGTDLLMKTYVHPNANDMTNLPDQYTFSHATPMHYASMEANVQVVKALIDAQLKFNPNNLPFMVDGHAYLESISTTLFPLISLNINCFLMRINLQNLQNIDQEQERAFNESREKFLQVAALLLKYGANPNATRSSSTDGRSSDISALHVAVASDWPEMCDLLVRCGGDAHLPYSGTTAWKLNSQTISEPGRTPYQNAQSKPHLIVCIDSALENAMVQPLTVLCIKKIKQDKNIQTFRDVDDFIKRETSGGLEGIVLCRLGRFRRNRAEASIRPILSRAGISAD